MRPFYLQGFLELDAAQIKKLRTNGAVREGVSMMWGAVVPRNCPGYQGPYTWHRVSDPNAIKRHGVATMDLIASIEKVDRGFLGRHVQTCSLAGFWATLYYRLPDWIDDMGVWNAAADEIMARGADPRPRQHKAVGCFLDLPCLHATWRKAYGFSPVWNLHDGAVQTMMHKCITRGDTGANNVQRNVSSVAVFQMSWDFPMQDSVEKKWLLINRNVNYRPIVWESIGAMPEERPIYSWEFIEALLRELRLPPSLFAIKSPRRAMPPY
jgi:hypothetical protein